VAMAAPLLSCLLYMHACKACRACGTIIVKPAKYTRHVYVRISVTDIPRQAICLVSLSKLASPSIGDHPHQPSGFVFPKQEFGHQTIAEWSFQATWFQHWSWLGQDIERKLTMLNPPFFCTQGVQHTIMHMRNARTTFILLPTALHSDSKADKHTHSSHLISDY